MAISATSTRKISVRKSFRGRAAPGAIFGNACFGGTVDVSAAYHHEHMRPDALSGIYDLGFEWQGHFFRFLPLPFGLATTPRIFLLLSWVTPSVSCATGGFGSSPI